MYKPLPADAIPTRDRKSESRLESADAWLQMKRHILRIAAKPDVSPKFLPSLVLTDVDKTEIGISDRRTYQRFVKDFIAANSLPFKVKSFRKDDEDYVIAIPLSVKTKAATRK